MTRDTSLLHPIRYYIAQSWGWALGLIIAFISLYLQLNQLVNQDIAWHLHVASAMREGKTLYVDFIDPNLPLVFYWSMLALWIADLLAIDTFSSSHFVDFSVALFCVAIAHMTLRFTSIGTHRFFSQTLLLILVCVVFILPLCSWSNDFFNKDVMVIPFIFPYLLLAIGRIEHHKRPNHFLLSIIASMAGFSLCIKPYFIALLIITESYIWWNQRKHSAYHLVLETYMMTTIFLTYIACVYLFHPAYFTHILPMILFTHPLFTNQSMIVIEFILHLALPSMAIIITALYCCRHPITRLFTLITLTFLAITFLQNKGWAYQVYPTMAMGYLLLVCVIAELWGKKFDSSASYFLHIAILVICLMIVSTKGIQQSYTQLHRLFTTPHLSKLYSLDVITRYISMIKKDNPNVLILSEALHHTYPAISYSKATTTFSLPFLFPLTAIENYRTSHMDSQQTEEIIAPTKQFLFDTLNTHLVTEKPDMIIARNRGNFHMRWKKEDIHLIDYFKQDPTFNKAFSHYTRLPTAEGQLYDIYYRNNVITLPKLPIR